MFFKNILKETFECNIVNKMVGSGKLSYMSGAFHNIEVNKPSEEKSYIFVHYL